MGVTILNPLIFEYAYQGLVVAGFNAEVQNVFSGTIHRHMRDKDTIDESLRLIKSWSSLNECSCYCLYDKVWKPSAAEILLKGNVPYYPKPHQLLKYLSIIKYNIELSTIEAYHIVTRKDHADYQLLKAFHLELMETIVGQLPEYQASKAWDAVSLLN